VQRIVQGLIALAIALAAYAGNALETLELAFLETRYNLLDRPATGELVAVQIDAPTIQELDKWPLPRHTYAFVVRALVAAGASEIAIDVDMSARTDSAETAALARALEDAGGHIILPAFTQFATPGDFDGDLVDAVPEQALAPHAWLGSVNVVPDRDGRLRQLMHGMRTSDGTFRYSMFALLAGRARPAPEPFYIDYGIDVRSIPRISFVDVLNGRFDVNMVTGKRIIIGGTAVELGDHFSVPRYGVMSGPMVQAMGFETLVQGREIHRTGPVAVVILLLMVLGAMLTLPRAWSWRERGAVSLGLVAFLQLGAIALQAYGAISVDVVPAVVVIVLCLGMQLSLFGDAQRLLAAQQKRIADHQRIILDRVVSDSGDGIAIVDRSGRIEMANRRTFDLCGVAQGETDTHLDDLFRNLVFIQERPASGWLSLPHMEAVVHGDNPNTASRHLDLTINRSLVPELKEGPRGSTKREVFGLTVRDVTDKARMIEAQRDAREQAERANRAKTDFLANMSHELRTPLNAVIGFSELMEHQAHGPLGAPDYLEYAAHIAGSGRHLLAIVNDIMDITRAEMDEVDLVDEPACLTEIAESAIYAARGDEDACAHSFRTEFDFGMPEVRVDAARIQRAIENLLKNAAAFSPPSTHITVRTFMDDRGCAVISVADEGEGISPDMLSSILMPFQQVRSSMNRTSDGIGLGLTIVSAYMKLHGGEVRIESEMGQGTTVQLVLPAARVLDGGLAKASL